MIPITKLEGKMAQDKACFSVADNDSMLEHGYSRGCCYRHVAFPACVQVLRRSIGMSMVGMLIWVCGKRGGSKIG